jgi:hypothetical protein
MNFSMPAVEALPTRTQMTFGGAPCTNDRLRKSSLVGCAGESDRSDVGATRELVSKCADQSRAQVLIKSRVSRHRRKRAEAALSFRGEREHGLDVFMTQFREIGQDGRFIHPARQVLKDIGDGDSRASHAGLAATHAGLDENVILPLPDGFKDRLRAVRRQISRPRGVIVTWLALRGLLSQILIGVGTTQISSPPRLQILWLPPAARRKAVST